MQLSVTRQDDDQWIVPTCAPADLVPAKAGGSRLWQQQGKSSGDFADVTAGSGPVLAHPRRQQTRRQLAEKLRHTGNGCTIEPMLRPAKQRITATFTDRVCFCHAAAEVSQAAVKLTCKAAPDPGPERINGIEAFHACTLSPRLAAGSPPIQNALPHCRSALLMQLITISQRRRRSPSNPSGDRRAGAGEGQREPRRNCFSARAARTLRLT